MNEQMARCPACGCELLGSVDRVWVDVGIFSYPASRYSPDSNWRQCSGCKDILCKRCYEGQSTFCCNHDRIAWHERAQAMVDFRHHNACEIAPPVLAVGCADANKNQDKNEKEEDMSDFKIVYLIVERGFEPNRQTFWRTAGSAFVCRDGSLNVRLDIHPGLTFNIRDPKSNGERVEAAPGTEVVQEVAEFPSIKAAA